MSFVVLNFIEKESESVPHEKKHIVEINGDVPVPSIGESFFFDHQLWRVVDVTHDYPTKAYEGERTDFIAHIWVTVAPDEEVEE